MNLPEAKNRLWRDVEPQESIGSMRFPLPMVRMVMAAAGTRDFTPIHHNSWIAQQSGAPDCYANMFFLQGMWECAARAYLGNVGRIRRITGLRMRSFNTVGDTVTVSGHVLRKWIDNDTGLVEIQMISENRSGVSVGPGIILASLPLGTTSALQNVTCNHETERSQNGR